jgi:transposase-like protein
VIELLRGGEATEISRAHGISQSELFEWRDRFLEAGKESLKSRSKDPERDKKIKHLERMVGRLTMENEILKKARRCIAGGDCAVEGGGLSSGGDLLCTGYQPLHGV